MIELRSWVAGPFVNNVYLLVDPARREAIVVDPGLECEDILETCEREALRVTHLVNTHGHVDHTAGNALFRRRTGAPLLSPSADLPLIEAIPQQARLFGLRADPSPVPDRFLEDGDTISFGGETIRVLHTPGHTPGGICLHWGSTLLAGDTLFQGSIGRTDLWGGDYETLITSIRTRLLVLPDETDVYPGHGPATTIGRERESNPFLQ